ncbi:MAG: response regulator transcription factor [Verrucomicrobia bacterium]|nr:response regulator transcription factor [Verrucomicrobiota bacterium]
MQYDAFPGRMGHSQAGTVSVVIADDHGAVRELLACYLKSQPPYVLAGEAATGPETLQVCAATRPAVLILDLAMPLLDGTEVIPQVRRISPGTEVLVFTGQDNPKVLQQVVALGARGIIVKRTPLSVLLEALANVSQGKAFFCPVATQALHKALAAGGTTDGAECLSLRERQVLRLVAEGGSTKGIADQLGISPKTVENHRNRLLGKLGAHNAADLTRAAFQFGLMQVPAMLAP